ncbi:MAG: Lrp/AsnC family transcriptional regulator [Methanomicrobiales archaeon]|nr:Lrp/AsnC family transcriptional regulator [Methanomicrobiales archaeon]
MDPRDLELLAELEDGLPFVSEPFSVIGDRIGMSEREVMGRLIRLCDEGIIRRFRARINQRQLGIVANALVAWKCREDLRDEAGARLASCPGVTHCYERTPVPGRWEYTLYSVHHGYSREEVSGEVMKIAQETGLSEFCIMFSTEEYKRVPNVRMKPVGGGA